TSGWSAKRQIMGQSVYNDKKERVGQVEDIIIAPDKAVSYAIVGAGGFLGLGKHDVAIPVNQFKVKDGKLVLAGATKETLKAMPELQSARWGCSVAADPRHSNRAVDIKGAVRQKDALTVKSQRVRTG